MSFFFSFSFFYCFDFCKVGNDKKKITLILIFILLIQDCFITVKLSKIQFTFNQKDPPKKLTHSRILRQKQVASNIIKTSSFFYFDAEEKIPFRSLNVYWHSLCICKETHHIIDVLEYRNDDDKGTFKRFQCYQLSQKMILPKWWWKMILLYEQYYLEELVTLNTTKLSKYVWLYLLYVLVVYCAVFQTKLNG